MSKRKLSPKKTPRQERSRATVEALLEATTDILIREGYTKLTTNRIAERAGVNIASLYQYFPGKEAIVAELRRYRCLGVLYYCPGHRPGVYGTPAASSCCSNRRNSPSSARSFATPAFSSSLATV